MKRLSEVQHTVLKTLSKQNVRVRSIGSPPQVYYRHEKLCNDQTTRSLWRKHYIIIYQHGNLKITDSGREALSHHENLPVKRSVPMRTP